MEDKDKTLTSFIKANFLEVDEATGLPDASTGEVTGHQFDIILS